MPGKCNLPGILPFIGDFFWPEIQSHTFDLINTYWKIKDTANRLVTLLTVS